MGLDLKHARGVELLMALLKISEVWMESSMPGTLERNGITNELALAVNPSLVIVRVSTYGQYGKEEPAHPHPARLDDREMSVPIAIGTDSCGTGGALPETAPPCFFAGGRKGPYLNLPPKDPL
jgi:hypothetical protein